MGGPKKEKSQYFKTNWSTKRFAFIKESFFSFLHACMFPSSYFRQRTYLAQDHMNGEPNDTGMSLCHICSLTKAKSWKHTRM